MGKASYRLWLCTGGIVAAGLVMPARATVTLTGQVSDVSFGAPLATQNIDSGFGDSTSGDGQSVGGSELDAAYATVQNGYLYVFLAGNFEAQESSISGSSANHINLFIDDNQANGQSTLNAGTSGYLKNSNGAIFSPGFTANFAIDSNDYQNTLYTDYYDPLSTTSSNAAGSYIGSIALKSNGKTGVTTGVGNSQNLDNTGIAIGFNNTNVTVTPNGTTGAVFTNTQTTAADAVSTGIDYGIPLSLLGNPTGQIELMALVNGGGDTGASNQFLPALPVGTGNLSDDKELYSSTNGSFNFNTAPNVLNNEFFTLTIPGGKPNGSWLPTGSGSWGGVPAATFWANGVVPGNPGDTAIFATATAPAIVTLDGNRTIGTLELNDANSYTIAQGTSGSLIFNNSGSDAVIQDLGGTQTISAPVVLNSNVDVGVLNHGDSMIISGNISGTGGLNVTNLGNGGGNFNPSALVLSGNNTYTGATTINRGTLQLGSSTGLPTGTALTLAAVDSPAGQLDLNSFNATIGSLSSTSTETNITNNSGAGNSTLTYAGTNTNPSNFNGNISDVSGTGGSSLSLVIASGSLTLSGTNSYGGSTTVNNGADLVLSSATASGSSFPFGGSITNNGSLEISDDIAAGISGSGATTVDAGMTLTAVGINQGKLINNGTTNIVGSSGTVGPVTGTGSLSITSPELEIVPGSGRSQQTSLTIQGGSTLDLTNNSLAINYGVGNPSPLSAIQSAIASGYNDGAWNGTGIISSTAAAAKGQTALGYADGSTDTGTAVPAGQVRIEYTLVGDSNLDGAVNLTDLLALLNNYGLSGKDWTDGDFNYDGTVNLTDLLALLNNYGQSINVSSLGSSATGARVVPEPATMSLLAMGGGVMLMRRRRKTRRA